MLRIATLGLLLLILLSGCGKKAPHTAPVASSTALPDTGGRAPDQQPRPAQIDHRPNILFVLTDDLSTDLLRFMPHVQQLARAGTTFSNYIVGDSLCCPSRASIFTGMLPHNTRVFTNDPPDGGISAFERNGDEQRSFARALFQRGYRTALLGKYLNGYDPEAGGIPVNWTDWSATNDAYGGFRYTLDEDGRAAYFGSRPRDYLTDVISAQAEQIITTLAEAPAGDRRPFFLELATFAPHLPATPAPRDRAQLPNVRAPRGPAFDVENRNPPRWLRRPTPLTTQELAGIDADYGRRARSVLAVDRALGELMDRLQTTGELENTYIVFSSDNGFHMGQHRLLPGKKTAFDTDIRVPLIIAGPGVPQGRRVDTLVQNTDLAPTFEELAGAPVPGWVDGRSLVPFLEGRTPARWRTAALIEHRRTPAMPGSPDYQPFKAGNPPTYEALRMRYSTYVESTDGQREFYDRRTDPNELVDIYDALPSARRRQLARLVSRQRTCEGADECAPLGP